MPHRNVETCIEACNTCAAVCDYCAAACLEEEDVTPLAQCIRTDLDCADICRLTASMLARGSDSIDDLCRLCAKICGACADACAQHDHEHCKRCTEACQRAERECQRMVA